MNLMITGLEIVAVTMWGPPGGVLAFLAVAAVAQRLGGRRLVPASWLSLAAIVTLMLGATVTWLEVTTKVPDAAQFRDLNTIIDERREAVAHEHGEFPVAEIVARLRWDLGERLARR